ncbi:hypothetical protein JRO89_XS11G0195400 [Xanthoceras sorbifolium]|uniref:Uncharacterized protein n=1 Tax=Xanthoceras sorbifolium TaxID=99658 RepID=A0ABQ8HGA6_9ROSI|nr:hypothetical protein JRO89_XS11G0195400 [Xanthoceras sorbifolium]
MNVAAEKWDDHPEKDDEFLEAGKGLVTVMMSLRKCSWARDKALNVIINNGSSTNVVAKEVVDQLSLPQETYPTPYKVSWINESNSVLVQTRFLVKFSLGRRVVLEPLPITEFANPKKSDSILTLRQVEEVVQKGHENKVANVLSRRPYILDMFTVNTADFDAIKDGYAVDPDFKEIWIAL